jgi:dTDP-4-dehydrorhamnose reductase
MKTIWVTGSKGQLGTEIRIQNKKPEQYNFIYTDIEELDLTNSEEVINFTIANKPDIIINCAAFTNVDKAESEKDAAFRLNSDVASLLSEISVEYNCTLIHISTDYVFDGKSSTPYEEYDPTSPQSVYGMSKLIGENTVLRNNRNLIIRSSWLYSAHGNNFLKTMLRLGKEKESLGVVYDQVGSPTSAADLALAILQICDKILASGENYGGIYHYSDEGVCSWYDFSKTIMKLANLKCIINPITTEQYPLPAKRPAYSVFNKKKIKDTFGIKIPYWRDSLESCIRQLI